MSIANTYQPAEQVNLCDGHHAGQPTPGDEQEDIVMTGTQTNILNTTCPLSGRSASRSSSMCGVEAYIYTYEKEAMAIKWYIMAKAANARCPVAGTEKLIGLALILVACPRVLAPSKVLCDPLLLIETEEIRNSTTNEGGRTIEDFTALDDED